MAGVYAVEATLRENPALAGLSIAVLHGRMAPEDKDATMAAFTRGETDVLVSTTVIEVGVDVPNATVMVVMDADRFGVLQRTSRGRVGRGKHPGLCLLATASEAEASRERLDAVAGTTDGFELARLDLELRGTGDVLSGRQSGWPLQPGDGARQLPLPLAGARRGDHPAGPEDAAALVEADPGLADHPEFRAAVRNRIDAEQAAFPERGDQAMTWIISGKVGGLRLQTLAGSGTRPTSDRVREALFSRLEHLDVVAGQRCSTCMPGPARSVEAGQRGARPPCCSWSPTAALRRWRAGTLR